MIAFLSTSAPAKKRMGMRPKVFRKAHFAFAMLIWPVAAALDPGASRQARILRWGTPAQPHKQYCSDSRQIRRWRSDVSIFEGGKLPVLRIESRKIGGFAVSTKCSRCKKQFRLSCGSRSRLRRRNVIRVLARRKT